MSKSLTSEQPTVSNKDINVKVDNVSIQFGAQSVVKDVSFEVKPGEVFAIMGASGAGKSVLLRSIIGLIKPTSGKIWIAGKDAAIPKTHQSLRSTIVFQAGALFNSMDVFDNLAFYPREHHLHPESKIREKVLEVLKMLSLQDAAYKTPAELSGGMRKRVAIARALVMEPQLLLYDEPTSELDPIMAATISEIIATLRKETMATSIVVTHDRDLANSIADRIALIHKGRLLAVQTPEELNNNPDPIVQDFLNPDINVDNPRYKNL